MSDTDTGTGPGGATERAQDRRGGPGHLVLLAVVFTVPVLKLAWTLGGSGAAGDALVAMEPGNWPDVLIGMLLSDPLLAAVLAVTASRTSYAYFAARGGAPSRPDVPLAHVAVTATVLPATFGLILGAFHGWWWGTAVALGSLALRLGVIAEYRTGRRSRGDGRRVRTAATTWQQRAADAARVVALLLAGLVLPVLAVIDALDGRAWTTVVECDVNTGRGTGRDRLVELQRKGDGVVGWDIEGGQVVNGSNCGVLEDNAVRAPWWNS
ncbi:hypothetical protein ACFYVL_36690 [Streptomyces sp. NPDC004111]|uniref:hypothetical protein n=1 Tax=Streptomyces sp. NPDC004111 TaxID=3364690 RepID=UPI0036A39C1C